MENATLPNTGIEQTLEESAIFRFTKFQEGINGIAIRIDINAFDGLAGGSTVQSVNPRQEMPAFPSASSLRPRKSELGLAVL
jgi:hypothetical protein